MKHISKKTLCACWFYLQAILIGLLQVNTWRNLKAAYLELIIPAIFLIVVTSLLYSTQKRTRIICSLLLIIYSIVLFFVGILIDAVAYPHTKTLALLILLFPFVGIIISTYLFFLINVKTNIEDWIRLFILFFLLFLVPLVWFITQL